MFLTLAAFSLAISQTKPAPAPVDRSAEPALRQMFATCGGLHSAHIAIEVYPHEIEADRYDDDSSIDLWLSEGNRFKLATQANFWGGGSLIVSDGLSVLTDDLSDDSAIKLIKPYKSLHEANKQEPILYLMEGDAGFDILVQKDQPVKFVPAPPGFKAIELHSKDLGKLVITYDDSDDAPFPKRIEEFKAPWWSDDAGKESDKVYTREDIRLVGYGPFDSKLFAVAAPRGKKVVDERSSK
jgi:hypothetical protein